MLKYYIRKLALLLIAGVGLALPMHAEAPLARRGVVRVELQPEAAAKVGRQARVARKGAKLSTGIQSLSATAQKLNAVSMEPVFVSTPATAERHAKWGLDRWYDIKFDESIAPEEAVALMERTPGVVKAQKIVPMQRMEGGKSFVKIGKQMASAMTASAMPFNDPRLPLQWHYHNDGSIADTRAGADINLFNAWKETTGRPEVIVAIIDGGVDYTHEDLAANMLVNEAEANGLPGVDDDGNGFIDDIYGYNFVTNSGEVYPHDHGTHVAGTVAAVTNNGVGVAGVAGGDGTPGSGCRIFSAQVFDSRAGAGEGDFAKAIVYAADRGASIAQCSWGWGEAGYCEPSVLAAIDYFTEAPRTEVMTGGLCIFATGNFGATGDWWPACYEKCLSVAAMTSMGTPASYSNYGEWVDVVAPGGLMDYNSALGVLSTLPGNEYGFNEGTSMATPHVSGIAALILSKNGKPDLLNETLRQQIVTSVNDFYSPNPSAKGLFGSGYVDAAKALRMSDGTAPEAVAAITLAPSQEEINVKWTIPAASDNNVNHHLLYYSTEAFDATSDLSKIPSVIVDTKFIDSGAEFSYDLTGLSPMTTYWIALRAVDRWGNASDLSPVVSASTNAGPLMTLPDGGMTVAVTTDATAGVTAGSFTIGNDDEGLLKWSAFTRTVPASLFGVQRPNPGKVKAYAGRMGFIPFAAPKTYFDVEDYDPDTYPQTMTNYDSLRAYIGESDPSLPNSLAQMFTVSATDYPQGFNLTHVNLQGAHGQNPVIQIYRGTSISSATLESTVDYQFWVYDYDIALGEQLFFAPGESFWVVFHFPASTELYPLGLGEAVDGYNENCSFMSTDNGQTWSRLSEVLKGSSYADAPKAWAVKAISKNPDWSQLLELTPSEGQVAHGETQTVSVSTGSNRLINGTYSANIRFTTNESAKNTLVVPVSITASGSKPEIVGPKVVNFGDLLVGQTKKATVRIYNKGYGTFSSSVWGTPGIYSDKITSSSEHFAGPDMVTGGFPARAYKEFEVTYCPQTSGSHTGVITFTDRDGLQYRLMVQGVATDPAKIAVDPAVVNVGDLEVGADPATFEFNISNTGKYPLEYVLPRFSDATIDGATGSAHRFGYTWTSTLDGTAEYDGNPALNAATDISGQFTDDVYLSKPISLGFDFPYYGKTYDKVYITSYGGICFGQNESTFRSPLDEGSYGLPGTGLISAWGFQMPMGPDSRVEYARQDGKFVVKFVNTLGIVYGTDYMPISFHIALSATGDIEIYYDDFSPMELFQSGVTTFLAINDPECADPLVLTSANIAYNQESPLYPQIASGTAFRFAAPKPYFVQSVEPATGLIVPGESVTLTATVQATDGMNAGPTVNNLVISSNDPLSPTSFVRFDANITGASLLPVSSVESSECAFGEVFRTAAATKAVTVKNAGHNTMHVSAIALTGDAAFSLQTEAPFDIEPGLSRDIMISLDTAVEGSYTGSLAITTDGGDQTVAVSATVIGCPDIALSYDAITETLESGSSKALPLEISNTGDEPLAYSVLPSTMVSFPAAVDSEAKTTYSYRSKIDDPTVEFSWIDNTKTDGVVHHGYDYFTNNDYYELELPFPFTFYGKEYTKAYVYITGFVSFTRLADQHDIPQPPAEFPAGSIYSNLIAPYWGMHTMATDSADGVFHTVSDNEVVISFIGYGNSMNIGVNYQLIMRPDGTFKFQYAANDENAQLMGIFGTAGVSAPGGQEGVRLGERLVAFGNAVEFSPVSEITLAPGAKKTLDVTLAATQLAGEYTGSLDILTNVPSRERVSIPVSLTVTGTPDAVFPADVEITRTVGYTDMNHPMAQMGVPYAAYLTVENKGTAPFSIDAVSYTSPTMIDEWFGDEINLFDLWYYADELDWMTGEPTGNKAWQQYMPGMMAPVTVGREPVQFAVPVTNAAYTPGEYEIPVTFTISGLDDLTEKTVNVKITITPAPVAVLDREAVHIEGAVPGSVGTEILGLSNYGEYGLDYTLYIDSTGKGEEIEEGGGGIAPMLTAVAKAPAVAPAEQLHTAIRPFSTEATDNIYDAPDKSKFPYNKVLYYPTVGTYYNVGSFTTFDDYKASVQFVSPEGGINISHIYTALNYTKGSGDYNVEVDIVSGTSPVGQTVLGHGSYVIQGGGSAGEMALIPLDRPLFLPEGSDFCVVLSCPKGVETPLFAAVKEGDLVERRYMNYYDSAGWYDFGSYWNGQYGNLGFLISCVETQAGKFWLNFYEGTPASGKVEVGETASVGLTYNTDAAPMEKGNKAMLVLKSNDPSQPVVNIPVILDKNGAPKIASESAVVYAAEGAVTAVKLTVSEAEADDFTVALDDNGQHATIVSATPDAGSATIDGANVAVTGASTVELGIELRPDYGDAGSYWMTFTAADSHGSSTAHTVSYVVEHSNRAPQPVEQAPLMVLLGASTPPVDLSALFTDPDGDDLTYAVSGGDDRIAQLFVSGKDMIVYGVAEGKCDVTVTATDPSGATATNILPVEVSKTLGIDAVTVESSLSVYPNPAHSTVNIRCDFSAADASIALYDIAGARVLSRKADITEGEPLALDVEALTPGTYLLRLESQAHSITAIVIKR